MTIRYSIFNNNSPFSLVLLLSFLLLTLSQNTINSPNNILQFLQKSLRSLQITQDNPRSISAPSSAKVSSTSEDIEEGYNQQFQDSNPKSHLKTFKQNPSQSRLLSTCTIADCITCVNNGIEQCVDCAAPKIPTPFFMNECIVPNYTNIVTLSTTCVAPNCVQCANFPYQGAPMQLCSQCQLGYRLMLLDGTCKLDSLFTELDNGFRAYGEYQYTCIEGCLRCQPNLATEICYLCKKGYALSPSTATCTKCSLNCESCDASTPGTCITCPLGFAFSSGQCLKCSSDACNTCSSTDQNICTSCKLSFKLVNGSCAECGPNCKSCSTKCDSCINGYFLATTTDSSTSCVKCSFGCFECSSLSTCTKCFPGFYQLVDKTCAKCDANCIKCTNDTVCTACLLGFDLFNTNCVAPVSNCLIRNINGTCRVCVSLYKMNSNETCDYNPLQQNPDNLATILCAFGLFNDNYACQSCGARYTRCTQCTSQKCTQCQSGYYVANQTNTCSQCTLQGCKDCQSVTNCVKCQDGYFLTSRPSTANPDIIEYLGQCAKCEQNCKTCHLESRICLTCNDNYTLNIENACEGNYKFAFKISLDFDFEADSSPLESVREFLAAQLPAIASNPNQTTASKAKSIVFKSIKKGSTIIEGEASQASEESSRSASASVSSALANTRQIGSVSVLSVVLNGAQVAPVSPGSSSSTTETKKDNTLAIVLGTVLGVVGLGIIIGVIVLIWRRHKSNQIGENNIDQHHMTSIPVESIVMDGRSSQQKSEKKLNGNGDNNNNTNNNNNRIEIEIGTNYSKSTKELKGLNAY